MSTETEPDSLLQRRPAVDSLAKVRSGVFRICFGDRHGLFVFLTTLLVMMLLWRFQVVINDNLTLANGLAAFADGHLHVTESVYGETLGTPGMVTADGRAYPRNIGHLVVSLPVLFVLRAVTVLMDLHVAVAAGWSLLLLATVTTGSRLLSRLSAGRRVGSALALLTFLASLVAAEPTRVEHLALPALQFTTLLMAAFICVVVYRVIRRIYDRRVGLTAGLAAGLATPTLLWATIPKRHVPVAALAVCSLYLLYRSRTATATTTYRWFRWLAYVPVGLSAWIFVAAGGTLFIALAAVDLASARENGFKSLAGVAGAVVVSSMPFFMTNTLIAGNPLTSPMMLPRYDPAITDSVGTAEPARPTDSPAAVRGASPTSPIPVVIQQAITLVERYLAGVVVVLMEPRRLSTIFVRSGWFEALSDNDGLAVNLSVAESMPLAGALVGLPVVCVRQLRERAFEPVHAVDAFVLAYTLLTLLFYLPSLPLHAMMTVRYLFVLYPLSAYGLVRLPWVRRAIRRHTRLLAWTYTGGVLIGGQLLLAALVLIEAGFEEGSQAIALLGLSVAGVLAAWSLVEAAGRALPRVGAVLLGLAGGCTTTLYFVMLGYYYGASFALPLVPG